MKRYALLGLVFAICCSTLISVSSYAIGLKITPLQYTTTLAKGEIKKGYIDISNPLGQPVTVQTSVQAFRQIDDNGGLEFYDSPAIKEGIKLDLDSFTLDPRDAIRMYFQIDGTKLPTGDVYAAIFFTSVQGDTAGVQPEVRVGSILSIVNGTPGDRKASISKLTVPWFQWGNTIRGNYAISNTADPKTSTGFYPSVTIKTDPFHQETTVNSSLLFAGRTRTNELTIPTAWPGIYRVQVGYGASKKETYVVLFNLPAVIVMAIIIAFLIGGGGLYLKRRHRSRRRHNTRKR